MNKKDLKKWMEFKEWVDKERDRISKIIKEQSLERLDAAMEKCEKKSLFGKRDLEGAKEMAVKAAHDAMKLSMEMPQATYEEFLTWCYEDQTQS